MSWFSTTIKVPVPTLQEYADKLQGFADDNLDIFDRVYKSLQCLKGSGEWQGASMEAIIEATENNKEKFQDTIDELQSLAEFLQKFVTEISKKDDEIRDKINAINE